MSALVLLGAKKFWILDPLYSALGTLVAWFYSVIPSYGFAIVLLTLAVRIVTLPLTAKQARAQQQMQQLQPELKRLQAKYKHDKQKMQEEVMKFYRENHANPFGSCLPVLIQAPILIVLYRLIIGLSDKNGPKHIPSSSALFEALKESGGEMASWGMDLARSAAAVSGADKFPYLVLVALVVATGYYQQRQLTARVPKENINPQMAMMTKVFPAIFGFVSFSLPAGVVVYFLVSNIWQVGQQAVMFRKQPMPATTDKGGAGAKGKDGGKGKGKRTAPAKGKGRAAAGRAGAKGPGAGKAGTGKAGTGKAGAGKAGATKGGPAKGTGAKGPGQRPAAKGGAAKSTPSKGSPGKGARKGSGRVAPRDDRGKRPAGKGGQSPAATSRRERPGDGAAAMGAMGAGGGDGASPKPATSAPAGVGGPTQPPKGKRRGRRGRPSGGPTGGNGAAPTVSGRDAANSGGTTSSGDGTPADEAAPTSTTGDDAQKGNA